MAKSSKTSRSTVYFEEGLYRALKVKAAVTNQRISSLVNEAVRESLREDAIDLEAIRKRRKEETIPYDQLLRKLKKDRLI